VEGQIGSEKDTAVVDNEGVGCYWARRNAEDVAAEPCFCVLCMLIQKGRGGCFAVLIGRSVVVQVLVLCLNIRCLGSYEYW